ncbi:MAG: CoA transferase [Burkholderiales bacterium]|nr:CoA transferase [Burkholderiales bacterium]
MFKNVKVLSFTHFLQGPSAVQMLSDLGADVVKIEPPKGAFERHWAGGDAFIDGVSVFYLLGNRNQRSLAIDLRSEEGKRIVLRLAKEADVLVENYRPGVMKRLGFGYEALKELNPRLIYCSCTGYGADGPYLERPGQDMLLQCISGMAALSGDGPPTPVGASIVDQHSAALAAFGIAAALYRREHTGQGGQIESNLLNAALDLQIEPLSYYLNGGRMWARAKPAMGSRYHPAPYGVYRTSDGWIAISLTTVTKLRLALDARGLESYDDRDQVVRREEVNAIIAQALQRRSSAEWAPILDAHDIWHAPVNEYAEVASDPQVAWNKMIMQVEHPQLGPLRLLAHPVRYDGAVPRLRSLPPAIGEHTRAVLQECGFDGADIERLIAAGVVVAAAQPEK